MISVTEGLNLATMFRRFAYIPVEHGYPWQFMYKALPLIPSASRSHKGLLSLNEAHAKAP